jgi:osmoprotectant transport system substrate-binding protein
VACIGRDSAIAAVRRRLARRGRPVLWATVALAILAPACSSSERAEPTLPSPGTIVVGSFDFPESEVLARIYGGALLARGYDVDYRLQIGPREIVQPALRQGLVDLLPEYAGSALAYLHAGEDASGSQETLRALAEELADQGLTVLTPAPAVNANAVVVTRDVARREHLQSISDLADMNAELSVGGPAECPDRPLCLPGLRSAYGLGFRRFVPYPEGAVTGAALASEEVDVGILFSTDGVLASNDLVVLKDDRHLQPEESVVPVVSDEELRRNGEGFAQLVDRVSSQLTTESLRQLNDMVARRTHTPAEAAWIWLVAHGFVED